MSFDELSAWERDQVARAQIEELKADDVALFDHARAAVPAPWSWPEAPDHLEAIWCSLVAPAWPHFDDVLTRYAAAKVFASWSLYLGDGVEAAAETARIAAAVLRIECARQCRAFGRPLDRELMSNAIGQSDLLLVHYADPERLASRLLLRRIVGRIDVVHDERPHAVHLHDGRALRRAKCGIVAAMFA